MTGATSDREAEATPGTPVRRSPLAAAALLGLVLCLAVPAAPAAPPEEPTPAPAGAEGVPEAEPLGHIVSATTPEALKPPVRPRLALVLSGGGARGAAHIGVLKVLEENHVVPDLVVGTSMGSIVGGLWSAGWKAREIEEFLEAVDWGKTLSDKVTRDQKIFRRKKDDDLYLIQAKIKLKGIKPYLPPGILGGQRLDLMLQAIEHATTGARDFDDFPVPYRAVAADLATGEAVVIGEGSLAAAMRASMAVPGGFSPVELNGRMLVDGGAVANLPVRIARHLGATRILAVDITSPLSSVEEAGASFLGVMGQNQSFLTVGNRLVDLDSLRPGDAFIRPELGDLGFMDFQRVSEAVAAGEAAAREALETVKTFSAPEESWAAFEKRHARRPAAETLIDAIEVRNAAPVDDEIVRRQVSVKPGESIDPASTPNRLMPLTALGWFGPIRTEFSREEERGLLTVYATKAPYGRNTIQVGINFSNDFNGGESHNLTLRHQLLAANRWGGEWQNIVQFGTRAAIASEFYQPLDRGLRWFAAPRAELTSDTLDLFLDGDAIAEYRVGTAGGAFDLGRVLGRWGEIRAGIFHAYAKAERRIGIPVFPDAAEHTGGWRAEFSVDTLDSTAFARRGTRITASYEDSMESLGADREQGRAFFHLDQTASFGKNSITIGLEASRLFEDETPTLFSVYSLGGFARLSGLSTDELLGSRGGLARLLYYRSLFNLDLGALSTRIYAGMSLEAGNVYQPDDPITWGSLLNSGSIFLGAETVAGPAYLAWGMSEDGRKAIYFVFGGRY